MERLLRIQYVLIGLLFLLISCSQSDKAAEERSPSSIFDVNLYSLNKVVCDPFGGSGAGRSNQGLKATLYYLNDDQPRYSQVSDYIDRGRRGNQFLFFSHVFVPTRMFSTGFPLETGDIIRVDKGDGTLTPLYEYFGLRYSSVLSLGDQDEEGEYELALLSDDGSILRVRNGQGEYEVMVDNDGDHPTKMGCSDYRLSMSRSTQKLIQLDYYQGPRYHISMIPLWRKVSPGSTQKDPLCGKEGNNYFFDENTSESKQPYRDLLARGWKPIGPENFSLPESAIFNPCSGGEAPVISDFTVTDTLDGVLVARWTTQAPSTSQLLYTNLGNGKEVLTESDNILRTHHEVYVSIPQSGTTYIFQGVSISESYGKSLSPAVTLVVH